MPPLRRRPGAPPYLLLAGVEPLPSGWLVVPGRLVGSGDRVASPVVAHAGEVVTGFREVLDWTPAFDVVAVHVPIGLPAEPSPDGRRSDREARGLLGARDGVRPVPARVALDAKSFAEARALDGGIDRATWELLPRIADVDREFGPYLQRTVYEVNPELTFRELNGGRALAAAETAAGSRERRTLLEHRLTNLEIVLATPVPGAADSRVLDACADLWTARRIAGRVAKHVPEDSEWDERGVRMQIWW